MPKILSMLGQSWEFCRKQPAIMHVGFWFLLLPTIALSQFTRLTETHPYFAQESAESTIISLLINGVLSLITLWGSACILFIGKRLLQAKSGRSRTSFKAVRAQVQKLYIPYLLTSILQICFALLWLAPFWIGVIALIVMGLRGMELLAMIPLLLPLAIPSIVYMIRTSFFGVIIMSEGTFYRPALKHSKKIVRGQFWALVGSLIVIGLCLSLPTALISGAASAMATGAPLPILLAADFITGVAAALANVLFSLTLIQLYGYFRPSSSSNH